MTTINNLLTVVPPRDQVDPGVGFTHLPRLISEALVVPVANVTTVELMLVVPTGMEYNLEAIQWFAEVVPVDADGTVLGNVIQRDASADAETTLVASQNLEALTAQEGLAATLASGITLPRVLDEHDSLRFNVVNNSVAIDTAGDVNCRFIGRLRSKS